MIACQQLAIKYGVSRQTIWNWRKELGIKPTYQNKPEGGLLSVLDDVQEKQLHDWLVKTGRIK